MIMKRIKYPFIYMTLAAICLVVIFPILLVVILPLQDSDELSKTISPLINFSGNYVEIDYFPQFPTFDNYKELLLFSPEFYKVFWNSLYIVGTTLLFQTLVAVPSAWAFAKLRFKYKKLIFDLYVIFMLMPFQVTMLSQYIVLDSLGLMNTRLALIMPAVFSTFPVFLIYRSFCDIPKDLIDSARIDGASEFDILFRIGIPLGKNGILASVVLGFLDMWNMVEQPLAFIKDKKLFPLSLYLPMLDISNADIMLAAAFITLIPAAFVFVIGQDYIEQGILSSALKE